MARLREPRRIVPALRRQDLGVAVEQHPPRGAPRQALQQTRAADHHRRRRVLQQEGEALRRVRRVERHVGAAGSQHAQQAYHQVGRALQEHPHPDLRPHAHPPQVVGQTVGAAASSA